MKVFMVWKRSTMFDSNEFVQMKVVFSKQEGLDSIPNLIEGALKHLKRDTDAFNLAKENKIRVYDIGNVKGDWVIEDLFTVEEMNPFYIESHLFPAEIREQMVQHGLSLLKEYKGSHPVDKWF